MEHSDPKHALAIDNEGKNLFSVRNIEMRTIGPLGNFSVTFWWDDCENVPFVLDQHDELACIVLAHWNDSPWVGKSLHLDTLFWFRAKQSLSLLLNAACIVEKPKITIL